jgi:hypothetical protein
MRACEEQRLPAEHLTKTTPPTPTTHPQTKHNSIYPVRKGETLADVMAKRAITRAEMEALNSSINLDRLKGALFWRFCWGVAGGRQRRRRQLLHRAGAAQELRPTTNNSHNQQPTSNQPKSIKQQRASS